MGARLARASAFLPCGLHFPPRRRSCRFIPHLLCAADTAKQVQGSSFREKTRRQDRAGPERELTQAPGGGGGRSGRWIAAKTRQLLRARTPGNRSKAGREDGQKGSQLTWTGPQTRPRQTWTCCGTLSPVSRSYTANAEGKQGGWGGGTSGQTVVTEMWTSSSTRVYLQL